MRKIIFLLYFLFILPAILLAQDAYYFVGIYQVPHTTNGNWCQDKVVERKAVKSKAEYYLAKSAFTSAHRNAFPRTYLLLPNKGAVLYEYSVKVPANNCSYRSYGVIMEETVDAARAELSKRAASNKSTYGSSPKVIYTWYGTGASKEVSEINHNGLIIKTTIATTASGARTTLVQMRNTSKDAVDARFEGTLPFVDRETGSNRVIYDEVKGILPGSSVNRVIKGNPFEIYTTFKPYQKKEDGSFDIIDKIKAWVRDQVTNGKIKQLDRGVAGPRG